MQGGNINNKTCLNLVEGPNGQADLFEIADESTTVATEYQVDFDGASHMYQAMGEAYIEAGRRAGRDAHLGSTRTPARRTTEVTQPGSK
jgi:hypothetical protein